MSKDSEKLPKTLNIQIIQEDLLINKLARMNVYAPKRKDSTSPAT